MQLLSFHIQLHLCMKKALFNLTLLTNTVNVTTLKKEFRILLRSTGTHIHIDTH